jgi:hypothetical protein
MPNHSFHLQFKAQHPANRLRSARWQQHQGITTSTRVLDDTQAISPMPSAVGNGWEQLHRWHRIATINTINAGLERSVKIRQIPRLRMALDMSMVNAACCDGDVPWFNVMLSVLPLTDAVFVAGSAATWMAEHSIARLRPMWDPTEIYVFVMVRKSATFYFVVTSVLNRFMTEWLECATPIRFRVMPDSTVRKIRVHWWLTIEGTEYPCPDFWFIHSTASSERDVLRCFEIDICRVTVGMFCDVMCLRMCPTVFQHIKDGHMHCNPRNDRCAERINRYTSRGYQLSALTMAVSEGADDVIVHIEQ